MFDLTWGVCIFIRCTQWSTFPRVKNWPFAKKKKNSHGKLAVNKLDASNLALYKVTYLFRIMQKRKCRYFRIWIQGHGETKENCRPMSVVVASLASVIVRSFDLEILSSRPRKCSLSPSRASLPFLPSPANEGCLRLLWHHHNNNNWHGTKCESRSPRCLLSVSWPRGLYCILGYLASCPSPLKVACSI